LALVLATALPQTPAVAPAAAAALERFFERLEKIRTLSYVFEKSERLRDGDMTHSRHSVKQRRPSTLYVRMLEPYDGQEILYDPHRDADHILVSPVTFPYVTLRLSIVGDLAIRRQHHIATHMGFDYMAQLLRRALFRARENPTGERFAYDGRTTALGKQVSVVVLYAGHLPPLSIRAQADENLLDFARRVDVDAYSILYENPSIDALNATLDAEVYRVPRYYGQKTELLLDEDTGLPVRQRTWDDQGRLYEHYEYTRVEIDPVFSPLDFDPDNPAYDF
jgi:outer membrane lipoprotein-sorting protein